MIKKTRAEITKCILHKVANKFNNGHNVFSEDLIRFDQEGYDLMKSFLLKPFSSLAQSYRFSHHADVRLNELNNYASEVFKNESSFIEYSKNIVNHLYEQSNSAQIAVEQLEKFRTQRSESEKKLSQLREELHRSDLKESSGLNESSIGHYLVVVC